MNNFRRMVQLPLSLCNDSCLEFFRGAAVRSSLLVSSLLVAHAAAHADCTREQAFNKMMAFNPVSAKLQQDWSETLQKDPAAANAKMERIKTLSVQIGKGSELLAAEKYGEACVLYDQLATQYGVSFKDSKTLTMEQLAKDGGRGPGGKCDITEAALRMKSLSDNFEKSMQSGSLPQQKQDALMKRFNEIAVLLSSDPSAACDLIDRTSKEYGWS